MIYHLNIFKYLSFKYFKVHPKGIFQSMFSTLSRPRKRIMGYCRAVTSYSSNDRGLFWPLNTKSGRKNNCFILVEQYLLLSPVLILRLQEECSNILQDTWQVSQVKSFMRENQGKRVSSDYNALFSFVMGINCRK